MSLKKNLSTEQEFAVQPTLNVVVQANAGTGKTFVLIERLLRILFREFDDKKDKPSGILCLTYTNAGAAEMRNRILNSVTSWARANDNDLRELLVGIAHANPPTDEDIKKARAIFYNFIDNPNILKIQTIHSFCEDILRRFGVEANVPPAWRLVSGAEQKRLLKDAFTELMNHPESETVMNAFDNVLGAVSEYSLDDLLESILGEYRDILLLKHNTNFPDEVIEKTREFLSINNPPQQPDLTNINVAPFLTLSGDVAKNRKLPPDVAGVADAIHEWNQYQNNLEIFDASSNFLILCNAFADKYNEIKSKRGLLDFDDMLYKTYVLFSNPSVMGSVLSQLDFNLKHIMVDESQDNSPIMWKIIFNMLDDFFINGEIENPRTFFAVGDVKQSIFSFQGANPSEFDNIPKKIGEISSNRLRQYKTVALQESRRTSAKILNFIDFFFKNANIESFPTNLHHMCWRKNDFGLVEINPLFKNLKDEKSEITKKKYVKSLANKIESLVNDEGISPDDIMVLVQRREPFVQSLIRELKKKNIKTSGSDKIVLPKFPAIRDLMNIIRFAINPNNDANLAFVLRSPICRWTETELYNICANRNPDIPLWKILSDKNPETYANLSQIVAMNNMQPFSFFSEILNEYRANFIAALGQPAIQPLDEFMTLCLSYERTQSGGLSGFLRWFLDGENEIKREMEHGAGVRILTAHSSKGLEASVVFLIDTTKNPHSRKKQRPFNTLKPDPDVFICKPSRVTSEKYEIAKETEVAKETEEYWRLLYVAMTRARDRLYIFGCEETGKNESWHSKLYEIARDFPDSTISDSGIIMSQSGTKTPPEKHTEIVEVPILEIPVKPLNERDIVKSKIIELDDVLPQNFGTKYGTDIHKKLQFLKIGANDELAMQIMKNPELANFWAAGSRAEVPLAGTIDGIFYSFRIDRMIQKDTDVMFLDYKTDTTRSRRDEYIEKLRKYFILLSQIYPAKTIHAYILWLHDWMLEKIQLS